MLTLEPPFYNVGGILIYRDHSVRTQFYYTAPSFAAPENVRFKYKLEGFDKDWIDSGTRRIDPLRTDIAAFIGVAERGRLDAPVRVS